MLKRIATATRVTSLRTMRGRHQSPLSLHPKIMQSYRTYADKVIKVPQMAESISEGTLKQFSKSIGDFVEQDEEIATIETDKVRSMLMRISIEGKLIKSGLQIDVAVNAPESGFIKEFLVSEEDTVTVGQDLVRIELGGAPSHDARDETVSTKKTKDEAKSQSSDVSAPLETKVKTRSNEKERTIQESQGSTSSPTTQAKQKDNPLPHTQVGNGFSGASSREERRVCLVLDYISDSFVTKLPLRSK